MGPDELMSHHTPDWTSPGALQTAPPQPGLARPESFLQLQTLVSLVPTNDRSPLIHCFRPSPLCPPQKVDVGREGATLRSRHVWAPTLLSHLPCHPEKSSRCDRVSGFYVKGEKNCSEKNSHPPRTGLAGVGEVSGGGGRTETFSRAVGDHCTTLQVCLKMN